MEPVGKALKPSRLMGGDDPSTSWMDIAASSGCHEPGRDSLRDVIAFPKTQKAMDLMSDAPTAVSNDQLVDLHVEVVKKEE